MPPITLYTEPAHYDASRRDDLIDLLKPFWGKSPDSTDEKRIAKYGISVQDFRFVENIEDSEMAVLPMSWNYYLLQKKRSLATDFIIKAQRAGKKVLSYTSGDFGVHIPDFDNLIVLRQSGNRSRLPAYHQGMPVFIVDPLQRYYNRNEIFPREKQDKPVIGFCGQAKGTIPKYTLDVARTAWRNMQYYLGRSPYDPQDLYPSTLRRAKVLKKIENDPRLVANFIKREQYRAGVHNEAERLQTTLEFYDNMVHSDYVVCVRGGGNFSVRLYETLAMGRIPVFVNTDCILPLANKIDWKNHVVWVEEKEIENIGNIIHDFHNATSYLDFISILYSNRKLWIEQMTLRNFFKFQLETSLNEKDIQENKTIF